MRQELPSMLIVENGVIKRAYLCGYILKNRKHGSL